MQTETRECCHSRDDSYEDGTADVTPSPKDGRDTVYDSDVYYTGGKVGWGTWGTKPARQRGAKLAGRRFQVRFLKVLASARTHIPSYKSREAFGEVLLSYLDEWAIKQAAAGIGNVDGKDYPF